MALRPFQRADFPRLISWLPDARSLFQWAGLDYSFPLDAEQLEANQSRSETDPPERCILKAVLRTEEAVGHVELAVPSWPQFTGRLGRILVAPAVQGRGYGLRIVEEACTFGFGALGLSHLDLVVFDCNTAAIACYERVGFALQGPEATLEFGGEPWRRSVMSLARDRWR